MVLLKNTTDKKAELNIKLFFQRTRKLAVPCVLQYRQIGKPEPREGIVAKFFETSEMNQTPDLTLKFYVKKYQYFL